MLRTLGDEHDGKPSVHTTIGARQDQEGQLPLLCVATPMRKLQTQTGRFSPEVRSSSCGRDSAKDNTVGPRGSDSPLRKKIFALGATPTPFAQPAICKNRLVSHKPSVLDHTLTAPASVATTGTLLIRNVDSLSSYKTRERQSWVCLESRMHEKFKCVSRGC